MNRMTTDNPDGNFETMLNFVHSKDGWAHIYDTDGKEVNLITWALNRCHDRGCDDFQCKTLEEYDEALSSCMVDSMDCPIAMAYCFASQAVHLRSRLKMYEDTMPLERVQELAQAEKDVRLMVLPCKVGDAVYFPVAGRWDAVTIDRIEIDSNGVMFGWVQYDVGPEVNELWDDGCFAAGDIGETVFLAREEAEAALKKKEDE